jgi:hypothetical protein
MAKVFVRAPIASSRVQEGASARAQDISARGKGPSVHADDGSAREQVGSMAADDVSASAEGVSTGA